jgi:hypothetical protein
MRRDVVKLERPVARGGDHLAIQHDDCADRHLAPRSGRLRLAERERHETTTAAVSVAHLAAPFRLCYSIVPEARLLPRKDADTSDR